MTVSPIYTPLIWAQVSRNILGSKRVYLLARRVCLNHVALVQFCHLLSYVTLDLFPSQLWHSLRCPNSSTSEKLLLSILVMCSSDLSPQASPRPTASTAHPTEGTPAGEGYPARHCWPGLHWPSQGSEEGYSEELGNNRGQGGTICALQVFISHGQPGVQLGLPLKS